MSRSHTFSVSQTPPKPAISPAISAALGFGSSAAIHQYAGHAYPIARIVDQISRWYSRYQAATALDMSLQFCRGTALTTSAAPTPINNSRSSP